MVVIPNSLEDLSNCLMVGFSGSVVVFMFHFDGILILIGRKILFSRFGFFLVSVLCVDNFYVRMDPNSNN